MSSDSSSGEDIVTEQVSRRHDIQGLMTFMGSSSLDSIKVKKMPVKTLPQTIWESV